MSNFIENAISHIYLYYNNQLNAKFNVIYEIYCLSSLVFINRIVLCTDSILYYIIIIWDTIKSLQKDDTMFQSYDRLIHKVVIRYSVIFAVAFHFTCLCVCVMCMCVLIFNVFISVCHVEFHNIWIFPHLCILCECQHSCLFDRRTSECNVIRREKNHIHSKQK